MIKMTVKKRIAPRLSSHWVLGISVTFFLLIGTELFLRVSHLEQKVPAQPKGWAIIPERSWIEYHPVLGWVHQKNKQAVLQKNGQEVPLTTNSLGLRGRREYSPSRSKGIRRIYALGDSLTFGFGVRDEDTFPAQMEKADASYEAMNFGVPGYGVDQIFLLLHTFGFAYQPDVVVITLYPEDFWRATRAFNDGGYGKPYFVLDSQGPLALRHVPVPPGKNFSVPQFPEVIHPSALEGLLEKSYLYRLARRAVTRLKKIMGREDPDSSTEWILGRAILKEMIGEIKSQRVRPVLVIAPPARWITGTVEPVRDSLNLFAAREGVEILDLTPLFLNAVKKSSLDEYYIPNDQHWTAKGNALVARSLLDYLRANPERLYGEA